MTYSKEDLCEKCAKERAERVVKVIGETISADLLVTLENWIHQNHNERIGEILREEEE